MTTTPPVHAGGFFCNIRRMPERADDELKLLLARAFDLAWKRYYRPRRFGAISESAARPVLAKHQIALAKAGVVSLEALAEGGFLHLVSITPAAQHWGHLRIEGAGSKVPAGMASSVIDPQDFGGLVRDRRRPVEACTVANGEMKEAAN